MNITWPFPTRREWLAAPRPGARGSAPADAVPAACDALRDLSPRTLADIGAPESLQSRARAQQETARVWREVLWRGGGTGDWPHW